jgi:Na+-driven multidrug efflux pump
MSIACPLGGVSVMVAAYFQSVGKAKDALLLTLGGIVLIKLPVLLLASRLFSLNGIWASEAVSELILCFVSLMMLRNYQGKAYLELSVEQV